MIAVYSVGLVVALLNATTAASNANASAVAGWGVAALLFFAAFCREMARRSSSEGNRE